MDKIEQDRPASVRAAFEVFNGKPDTGPHATALFRYIESLEAALILSQAETIAELKAEIERLTPLAAAYDYLEAPSTGAGKEP